MTDPPIRQQVMKYLAEQFPGATLADHQFGADGLLAIFDAEAARVCVEAVAEWARIVAVIEQYLPEALPFNSLSEIVGGIARQRDFQHELKDHLAEVARRLTDGRDAAVARAVADERQRIAADIRARKYDDAPFIGAAGPEACSLAGVRTFNAALEECASAVERGAAGSVPVATPEPATCKNGHSYPHLATECPGPVATPTEPDEHERQHLDYGTWPCAWRGSAECPIVEELAGAASPVSAVQPSFCGHTDAEGCTGHGDF